MRYERQIFSATVFLCLLSVAAYWFMYHLPLERELLQLERERNQTSQQSVDIINFRNEHGDLETLIDELNEQQLELDRALPAQLSQGEFISYIQATALKHQIRLISLTPGTATRDSTLPITRLPIQVRVECTYFKLLDFLAAIEGSERLINVENFSATSDGKYGDFLTCSLEIVLFATEVEGDEIVEISDGG